MTKKSLWSTAEVAKGLKIAERTVRHAAVRLKVGTVVAGVLVFTKLDIAAMRKRRTIPGPNPGANNATNTKQSRLARIQRKPVASKVVRPKRSASTKIPRPKGGRK